MKNQIDIRNPIELFAECFAFYLTGRELPKKARALLDRSIAIAKVELKGDGKEE